MFSYRIDGWRDMESCLPTRGCARPGQPAESLNEACFCISLNNDALRQALEAEVGDTGLFNLIAQRCSHVFSARPVFMSDFHARQIQALVRAIHTVVSLPAYRAAVLATAPPIARHSPGGPTGVFFGYDFHLHEKGVALIEINTNAGGAMLNAVLAKAQRACCEPVRAGSLLQSAENFEARMVAMFVQEWERAGRTLPLRTIALVDEKPEGQYLYPEFLLFQRLLRRHGFNIIIADPGALSFVDGKLRHGETAIDLVYNRLTDFMLDDAGSAALRAAYLAEAVVLTPHPQAHALFANKGNLAIFTDSDQLTALGVDAQTQAILLAGIPHTEIVEPVHAERLWAERRTLFFKPLAGFGSRAAYRGDKITKRVWQDILAGSYVAQKIALPSVRATGPDQSDAPLKFDIRAYVYDGIVQWTAARLYAGQTTNFRTAGGGFAPVYTLP